MNGVPTDIQWYVRNLKSSVLRLVSAKCTFHPIYIKGLPSLLWRETMGHFEMVASYVFIPLYYGKDWHIGCCIPLYQITNGKKQTEITPIHLHLLHPVPMVHPIQQYHESGTSMFTRWMYNIAGVSMSKQRTAALNCSIEPWNLYIVTALEPTLISSGHKQVTYKN